MFEPLPFLKKGMQKAVGDEASHVTYNNTTIERKKKRDKEHKEERTKERKRVRGGKCYQEIK